MVFGHVAPIVVTPSTIGNVPLVPGEAPPISQLLAVTYQSNPFLAHSLTHYSPSRFTSFIHIHFSNRRRANLLSLIDWKPILIKM